MPPIYITKGFPTGVMGTVIFIQVRCYIVPIFGYCIKVPISTRVRLYFWAEMVIFHIKNIEN